jgi:hypothetical protein
VPQRSQATNLLVPVCCSASHIAYGSIRMEPVFMVLGQSAATAAAQAIDAGVGVQRVDYARLKARLLQDGQVLDFESPPLEPRGRAAGRQPPGIVVDDNEAKLAGFDSASTSHPVFVGVGYRHDGNDNKGRQTARFTPDLPKAGRYRVAIAVPNNPNRATNVPVTIRHADGETKVTLNQRKEPSVDKLLEPVGTFRFAAGRAGWVEISNAGTNGYVVVDAVQWLEVP